MNNALPHNPLLEQIANIGIVPVVVLNDAKDALPLAQALCDGGLPCAEVTYRTEAAEESIRQMAEQFPDMLIGAGTVLTTRQVDSAVSAGAKFIVSPGLNPKIIRYCQDKNILMIPGVSSPSDIEQALDLELDTVKFFPAEAAGGLKMIQAMSAPYTNVRFLPTGGICAENLKEYLAFPKVIACGGSWMVKENLIREGQFDRIRALTGQAVMTMLDFEVKHVGINCENDSAAEAAAAAFSSLFGFSARSGALSIFAGSGIEIMKMPYLGAKGHIAIGTSNITRAVHYLKSKGVIFKPETAKYTGSILSTIYLEEEIGGFGIHLIQK